ncbi:hypothetical protein [Lactiplantibacillus mudanjiangensis]|uniref:Uncharacterized protein n=1 Tax=Lactiplantibacillus mudanjiangensis TaxID=1296538 RepID=A0A660E5R0_9LACO|nr:hypothetical protein [Lactiplantibacillus mudanjiangensis]VDG23910.1 hypothetical protein [Lactobacillus curieae] [Lactiplantibacillus mudanjiangensis]VDG30139.1 hypothetical protein [Lactobacillus curieae] [Lactiplantibacillus mudanjiangensis]
MKKTSIIWGLLLSVGLLSGCSASRTPSYHKMAAQFESQSTKSKQAPKDTTKAKTSTSHDNSNGTATTLKDFKAPKKAQHDRLYVKSGQLTKAHQYTYDQAGTKVSLTKIKPTTQSFTNGHVTFKFTQIRILKNQPTTKNALKMANQALNTDQITGTYYTLQLRYTVANHRDQSVNIDGITAVKTDQGQTLTQATQMYDAGAGLRLTAKASKTAFTMALITSNPTTVKQVQVELGGIFTPSGKTLTKASDMHTLRLQNN